MTDATAGSLRQPVSQPFDRGPIAVAGGGLVLGALVIW